MQHQLPYCAPRRAADSPSCEDGLAPRFERPAAETAATIRSAQATEYRRYAQSCRDMAERAPTEEDRSGMLRLAEAWEQLAL
jgi:hypothetical protein